MSTISAANISDGTDTVGTEYVVNGSAKAWVSGSGAAVIFDSFNVSSAIDDGTGQYSYIPTNSFANLYYSLQGAAFTGSSTTRIVMKNANYATSSRCSVHIRDQSGSAYDCGNCVSVDGELA